MFLPDFPDRLKIESEEYRLIIDKYADFWLLADQSLNDSTAFFLTEKHNSCLKIVAKNQFFIAGIEELEYFIDSKFALKSKVFLCDGFLTSAGDVIMEIHGSNRKLVAVERFLLNLLARMCTVATKSSLYVNLLSQFKNKLKVASTRKGILSVFDKKAASVAGVLTHRLNLNHAIMIKDNHRQQTINSNFLNYNFDFIDFLEFEFDNINQFIEHQKLLNELSKRTKIGILLDNFNFVDLDYALQTIPSVLERDYFVEVSGGINLENFSRYDLPNIDFVSTSDLFYSDSVVDLSAELEIK